MASTKTPEQMAEEYSKQITMQDHCDSEAAWYAEKDFLAGYQAAKPQWISVKERLPEIGAPCLVTCHEERYTIAEYDGIKWTTLNSIAYYHPIVTHWQWLPEIPNGDA